MNYIFSTRYQYLVLFLLLFYFNQVDDVLKIRTNKEEKKSRDQICVKSFVKSLCTQNTN